MTGTSQICGSNLHPDEMSQIDTPALILDLQKLRANCARMASFVKAKEVALRPHVKTHKSIDVWNEVKQAGGTAGITVSTLAEAEHFHRHGADDMLYAVGLVPHKVRRIAGLQRRGAKMTAIVDEIALVPELARAAAEQGIELSLLIELDVDGHRAGIAPLSDELVHLARAISDAPDLYFAGLMTHAGGSYGDASDGARNRAAQNEARLCAQAADRLREAGLPSSIVSIGSTPTALADADLAGITELRAGVYTFFDLVMAGIGVAEIDEIALSVATSVIGYHRAKSCIIVDAGWMALSRDRGTASQKVDQGYGLVCDENGNPIADLIVRECNQEHGIIGHRDPEQQLDLGQFPLGMRLRVLPNHACATAAQHSHYLAAHQSAIVGVWPRIGGW